MNTTVKILLIGSGLTAFYLLRKHADKKFAANAGVPDQTTSIIETVKNMLPADILPEKTPSPTPPPTPAPATSVESTTQVFQPPTVVKTTTTSSYLQPRLNTFTKVTALDQRVLAGCGLR